jgi:hypothetical protein
MHGPGACAFPRFIRVEAINFFGEQGANSHKQLSCTLRVIVLFISLDSFPSSLSLPLSGCLLR